MHTMGSLMVHAFSILNPEQKAMHFLCVYLTRVELEHVQMNFYKPHILSFKNCCRKDRKLTVDLGLVDQKALQKFHKCVLLHDHDFLSNTTNQQSLLSTTSSSYKYCLSQNHPTNLHRFGTKQKPFEPHVKLSLFTLEANQVMRVSVTEDYQIYSSS